IQQRFKGVGMRWSEAGFNHLLHLRLAWVNQRFDSFFPDRVLSPPTRRYARAQLRNSTGAGDLQPHRL
ncbi:MAG: hypothetical protein M3255_06195, partial [Pseudomonadota bacterium]|nr:hypothetical protein [Pseudomonadota bacterium]